MSDSQPREFDEEHEAAESAFELTDDEKAELDRRLASRSRARGRSWEEVKERILGRK